MATKTLIIASKGLLRKTKGNDLRLLSSLAWHHSNSWNSRNKVLSHRKLPEVCALPNHPDRSMPANGNSPTIPHIAPPRSGFHSSIHFHQRQEPVGTTVDSKTSVEGEAKTQEEGNEEEEPIIPIKDETGKPLSNWARMKIMMKTYGYVIIPVHWVIAPVWFGGFYYAIKIGIDIEPMLTKVGVSDHHIETLKNSKASTALMAYALYKIFTPLRYTVTLGATEVTIRALRKRGFIKPTPPKEKTYRQSLKDTVDGVKDRLNRDKES